MSECRPTAAGEGIEVVCGGSSGNHASKSKTMLHLPGRRPECLLCTAVPTITSRCCSKAYQSAPKSYRTLHCIFDSHSGCPRRPICLRPSSQNYRSFVLDCKSCFRRRPLPPPPSHQSSSAILLASSASEGPAECRAPTNSPPKPIAFSSSRT